MNIEDCTKHSMRNAAAVKASSVCGCYFCISTFPSAEVSEWADKGETAICPRCDIDAVLPGVTDLSVLRKACERWFTAKNADGTTVWVPPQSKEPAPIQDGQRS